MRVAVVRRVCACLAARYGIWCSPYAWPTERSWIACLSAWADTGYLPSTLLTPLWLRTYRSIYVIYVSSEFAEPWLMCHQPDTIRTDWSLGKRRTVDGFSRRSKRILRLFIHSSCGFQFSFSRACGAVGCCCKTCWRELGRHFLSHVGDLPLQPLAAGRVQVLWGRGRGEKNGRKKNWEVERLTSQRES